MPRGQEGYAEWGAGSQAPKHASRTPKT